MNGKLIESALTPWYQEKWIWFLIAVPMSAVLFGFLMLFTALQNPDDLVADDYYKQGMGINRSLTGDRFARDRGIEAHQVAGPDVHFEVFQVSDVLLVLNLYHVTDRALDFSVPLYPDAGQLYSSDDPQLKDALASAGVWYAEIKGEDDQWRIRSRITTPATQIVLR